MNKVNIKYSLMSPKDKILYLKQKRHRLQMYRRYLIDKKIKLNYLGRELESNSLATAYAQFESEDLKNAIYTVRNLGRRLKNK